MSILQSLPRLQPHTATPSSSTSAALSAARDRAVTVRIVGRFSSNTSPIILLQAAIHSTSKWVGRCVSLRSVIPGLQSPHLWIPCWAGRLPIDDRLPPLSPRSDGHARAPRQLRQSDGVFHPGRESELRMPSQDSLLRGRFAHRQPRENAREGWMPLPHRCGIPPSFSCFVLPEICVICVEETPRCTCHPPPFPFTTYPEGTRTVSASIPLKCGQQRNSARPLICAHVEVCSARAHPTPRGG